MHEMRRSLAVANSQLLPHTVLVDVLLQQREIVTQRSLTLLADVVHIHVGVDGHDRRKLGCLAVLQGQLAHQTYIPAVAQLNPNPAERERLHDTTSSQLAQHVCCLTKAPGSVVVNLACCLFQVHCYDSLHIRLILHLNDMLWHAATTSNASKHTV
jgi:hypothetical protein